MTFNRRGEQARLQKNYGNAGEDVDLEAAGADGVERVIDLFARCATHLSHRFAENDLFARVKDGHEQRAHHGEADQEKQQHAEQFAEQILESRHRLN